MAIHNNIVELARNEVLSATHTSLTNRSQRGRFFAPRFSQDKLDRAMAAHGELMQAVGDRDSVAAARIMNDHLKTAGQFVLDSIQRSRASQSG